MPFHLMYKYIHNSIHLPLTLLSDSMLIDHLLIKSKKKQQPLSDITRNIIIGKKSNIEKYRKYFENQCFTSKLILFFFVRDSLGEGCRGAYKIKPDLIEILMFNHKDTRKSYL